MESLKRKHNIKYFPESGLQGEALAVSCGDVEKETGREEGDM
jgi:hypothetical protein